MGGRACVKYRQSKDIVREKLVAQIDARMDLAGLKSIATILNPKKIWSGSTMDVKTEGRSGR